MATDAKKHTTLAAGEKPSRSVNAGAGLAEAILSINDVIPVANTTEANQVAAAVIASGQNLATNPVVVSRADARGLHRIEVSYNGTVWVPASGVLPFASKGAADTWASANSALLTVGDRCRAGSVEYRWTGTAWGSTPLAEAAGSVPCPSTAGGGSTPIFWSDLIDVTFPVGVFSAAPHVFVQTIGPDGQVQFGGLVEQRTATGCKVRGMRIAAVPTNQWSVSWWAVQP